MNLSSGDWLIDENIKLRKKLTEAREILKDFMNTVECHRTWKDEMFSTIAEFVAETREYEKAE